MHSSYPFHFSQFGDEALKELLVDAQVSHTTIHDIFELAISLLDINLIPAIHSNQHSSAYYEKFDA